MSYDLAEFHQRLLAICERLKRSDSNIDFRFVNVPDAVAQTYMEQFRKPQQYGWSIQEVQRLNQALDGRLPEDFQIYLELLGNHHVHFFDSYEAPRNPKEFVRLQEDMKDYFSDPEIQEEWSQQYPNGLILPSADAIHVCWHQGYALTYIQPQDSSETLVRSWLEKEIEKAKIVDGAVDFNSKGTPLLEYLEGMMDFLEELWRPKGRGKFIHIAPDGMIQTVYPSQNSGFEPLRMPHQNYHVEATPELLAYLGLN